MVEALRIHHAYAFAIWFIYAGRSSFIQFWEGSLVCRVYHWRSVMRNIIFHFCSLQMVLVHIVKSIRWVIESSRNADLFVVSKRGCSIFRVKGLHLTILYIIIT